MIKFGSVCSGIEAASVAFNPLGWRAAWFSEIEPFPCAVLKNRFPDVENLGDMTKLAERIKKREIEAPDVFCGGTPCQAFSIAGLRKSLDDDRGNLSLTFCEIADEIDNIRTIRRERPCVVFWENVPGVLSTKDNAFGCFLGRLVGSNAPLSSGSGRWPSSGYVAGPKRKAAWRVLDAQHFGVPQRRRRVFVVASANGGGIDPTEVLFERAGVLGDSEEGFRKGQAIAGRSQNSTGESSEVNDINVDVCYDISHPCDIVRESMNITPTLQSAMGTGGNRVPLVISKNKEVSYSIAENIIGRQPKNGGNGSGFNEEICYTLNATGVHGVAHCFKIRGGSGDGRKGYLGQDEKAFTLATHQDQQLFTMNRVRKLTPLECERLQGFPDNWTRIPYRGKSEEDCPDSPRYKAIGNSWAVPCVRWIGKRINKKLSQQ